MAIRERIFRLSHRAELRLGYSDIMKYVTFAIHYDAVPLLTKDWKERNVVFVLSLSEAKNLRDYLDKHIILSEEGIEP